MFSIGDKNNNGKLSMQEFKDMLTMFGQPVPEYQLNQVWFFLDSDRDGELSKQELRNFIDTSSIDSQIPAVTLINQRQNGAFDADPSEYRVYTKTEKVNFLFSRYDIDKNGVLTFGEA